MGKRGSDSPHDSKKDLTSLIDLGLIDHEVTNHDVTGHEPAKTEQIEPEIISTSEPLQEFEPAPGFEVSDEAPSEISLEPTSLALEPIREYAETAKSLPEEIEVQFPFHFYATGTFTFFERDKLLRFITENPIGITSAELDLQIDSGKVFLPRISEFAGIKLIQELRDSPLEFRLAPVESDSLDVKESPQNEHWVETDPHSSQSTPLVVSIIDAHHPDHLLFQALDTIQVSQYLKAEMVEVEQSEIFQEMVDRLIESLKAKAARKGAEAISKPVVQLQSLRLPSQYQVQVSASVLTRVLK